MTEEQIIEEQSTHHDMLMLLRDTHALMANLNDHDHHIERQIIHTINLIKDKDQRIMS